MTRNLQY